MDGKGGPPPTNRPVVRSVWDDWDETFHRLYFVDCRENVLRILERQLGPFPEQHRRRIASS